MNYVETIHKRNKELIKEYDITIGDIWVQPNTFPEVAERITHIHSMYGWMKTNKGDAQKLPQEVEKALNDGWTLIRTTGSIR